MHLDFGAIQNIQSDIPTSGKDGPNGRPASDRVQGSTSKSANGSDFHSSLKHAESRHEIDTEQSDNRNDPVAQTKIRSSTRANEKIGNNTKQDIQSNDGHNSQGHPLAVNDNKDHGHNITTGSNELEALDPNFALTINSIAAETEDLDDVSKGIPVMTKPEGHPSASSVAGAQSTEPTDGSSVTGTGTSLIFNNGKADSVLASVTRSLETPDSIESDHISKVVQTTNEKVVKSDMAESVTGPQGKELMGKITPETQNDLARSDHTNKTPDTTAGYHTDKTMADVEAGLDRFANEIQKKMKQTFSLSEKAHEAGGSLPDKVGNGSNKSSDIEHLSRMFVESDRHIQADKTSNGQGEMRGSQDGSNISAQKFNAEVEQNIKTNDLILPSQRPVVGEGSPHPNTELGDIRANATKTDVLNQIVDRAVFKLNNEQSEVRIDLKPDFLGHVRLQIVTDSHQVNLRILAESSIVKELIDGNLNQLKNDLQAQGLKVEEIEVAVAKDFNDYSRNQDSTARGGPGKRGFSLKDQEGEDGELPENNIEPTQLSTQPGGVNCFA